MRNWSVGMVQANTTTSFQADALQGIGVVISLTDCYRRTEYGEPVNALKSYILSPFSDDTHVR